MRILVVSYAPLDARFGASQLAIHLAGGLRRRGHFVETWTPPPVPASVRRSSAAIWRRDQLARKLRVTTYDVVDLPPIAIDHEIAGLAPLVARTVQPDLLYLWAELRAGAAFDSPRSFAAWLHSCASNLQILRGLRLASFVLCLGTQERDWLDKRIPRLRPRLAHYLAAVDAEEKPRICQVAQGRRRVGGSGIRFLWIGRWVAHKGTKRLVRFASRHLAANPLDKLTIAGVGQGFIAPRVLPLGLLATGRVEIVPEFSRAELPALLARHDAGLFTSMFEGWGISLNEMLESGMPVFATDAGGVPDLKPYFPKALRSFPPDNITDLSVDDPPRTAYDSVFNWDAIAERYEKTALRQLAARRSP